MAEKYFSQKGLRSALPSPIYIYISVSLSVQFISIQTHLAVTCCSNPLKIPQLCIQTNVTAVIQVRSTIPK